MPRAVKCANDWRSPGAGQRARGGNRSGHADPGPARSRTFAERVKRAAAIALALAMQTAAAAQPPAFHSETRLVVVHATVRNARAELVTGLGREAFAVYEDGRRQPITLFRNDDIPVSLGLLID